MPRRPARRKAKERAARTPARRRAATPARRPSRARAGLATPDAWDGVFEGRARAALERRLPAWLSARRWYGGKARPLRGVKVLDAVPIPCGAEGARLVLVEARYRSGPPQAYAVPLTFSAGAAAEAVRSSSPGAVVAPLTAGGRAGALHAVEADPAFARALLQAVAGRARLPGAGGDVVGWPTQAFAAEAGGAAALAPSLLSAEQSNTSIRFGDRLILKLFRRIEPGPNPDLEVGAYLTDVAGFGNTPPVLGGLEYRPRGGEPWSLAILQAFVPNQGDAWRHTLEAAAAFLARAAARGAPPDQALLPAGTLLDRAAAPPHPELAGLVGPYLEAARLLGRRTAELHLALAAHPELPAFAPEPYTPALQRELRDGVRALLEEVLRLLRRRQAGLPAPERALAARILAGHDELAGRLAWVAERPLSALRTRTHGDYHLGQVLWTGQDFMIIDFEGEPARPLAARRAKASPLRDVAGMLRSFHYAAHQALAIHPEGDRAPPARRGDAARWAEAWQLAVSAGFLAGYLASARGAPFLPAAGLELQGLLELFLTEKAVYELAYELNNRPAWIGLPLHGLAERLGPTA